MNKCKVCGKETNRKQRLYCSDKCGMWWSSSLVQERFNQGRVIALDIGEIDILEDKDFRLASGPESCI